MDRALTSTEYRLLVEHAPVMIWRAGLDAKCDYFNETWLSFTGRTLQQESGRGWTEGVHPADFSRCVSYYLDHFRRREPFEMEYRLRRHDGTYRWILDRGVPVKDDDGQFAGYIGSCVDIEDRRMAEEATLQHNEEQLALARDFEKWILAIVGHDIRNPLNSMQLAAHVLQKISASDEKVSTQAEVVMRGVHRIQHIVGDLLDLSREREGAGIPLDPKPGDLRVLCQRIIDETEALAKDRKITFDCEATADGVWDEHRVLQAVSNLVCNAVQHGTPGSPIRIRIIGNEEAVAVEVRSEGTIPAERLPRLFTAFRSGRASENRGEGLGLGLFITKAIARAHGGEIEARSSDGHTMFRLVLPRSGPATEKGHAENASTTM